MKNIHRVLPEEMWESGKLGASGAFAHKVSAVREKAVDDRLGLQMISIRIQKELIDELKALAREAGIGYQPYIRQLLTRHASGKRKRDGTYG